MVTRTESISRVLEHDCSTLGGNSGSCVLTCDMHTGVGLHFGGRNVDDLTGRGEANLAVALSLLGEHPAAEILRRGRV
jgi:V8-like Glu-specific endopeptidase